MKPLALSLFRHIIGYGLVVPLILLAIALQALIFGPLLRNQTTLPHFIYRLCGAIFGVRFQLNPASTPFSPDRPTLFLSNHLSRLDFAGLHLFPDAALMMNAMFFKMPVFGPIIRLFAASAGLIGTEQTQAGKRRDQQAMASALSQGRALFVYAEGIQTDGRRVLRYSQGAAEILYDPALLTQFPALTRAVVQPVIYRVRAIEGEEMLNTPEKWGRYTLSRGRSTIFAGMSRLSLTRSITIDILVCPPLIPADYETAAALTAAAQDTARTLIAPHQTKTLTRREWKRRLDERDFTL